MNSTSAFYFIDREIQNYINSLDEIPTLIPYNFRNKGLRFMQVMGPLENMYFDQGEVVFIYDEDTFNEEYMQKHARYFLTKAAPVELKQMFYNPVVVTGEGMCKRPMTADIYEYYYEWLSGKYLERFAMEPFDRFKINMINDQKKKTR